MLPFQTFFQFYQTGNLLRVRFTFFLHSSRLTKQKHSYYSPSEGETAQNAAVVVLGQGCCPVDTSQDCLGHRGQKWVNFNSGMELTGIDCGKSINY